MILSQSNLIPDEKLPSQGRKRAKNPDDLTQYDQGSNRHSATSDVIRKDMIVNVRNQHFWFIFHDLIER
jgi:hypothetical protein